MFFIWIISFPLFGFPEYNHSGLEEECQLWRGRKMNIASIPYPEVQAISGDSINGPFPILKNIADFKRGLCPIG